MILLIEKKEKYKFATVDYKGPSINITINKENIYLFSSPPNISFLIYKKVFPINNSIFQCTELVNCPNNLHVISIFQC